MRVNKFLLPILVLVTLIGSAVTAQLSNNWAVTGKDQVNVDHLTSEDIRGWMTIQQIADGFDLSLDELYDLLELPSDIPYDTALKDLEKILPGFEVNNVKEAIEPNTILSTADISPTPTPTIPPILVVETPASLEHEPQSGPTPLPADYFLAATEIKGRTTLKEIIENGMIPHDDLLLALGLPMEFNTAISVKDLVGKGNVTSVEFLREVVTQFQNR
jgi:hypothetical protein